MSLDLPMHLTNCWIHRAALRICLVAVSERLAREERKVPVLVIGLENLMSVRVAGMDNLAAAYVRRGVLRDRGQVMPANVGAFALMTVIDMSLVWMRDFGDLTDAGWRRRSPRIRRGVPPGVLNGSHIPSVGIISYMSIVPLKIGVISEHFVMRFAFPIGSATVTVVADTWHEVSVSEGTAGSIASRLSESIWASTVACG